MITGEPIPVEKRAGSKVTGGTVNGSGSFIMRAERVGGDTLLAQIVRMVGEAQRSRAPIERLAEALETFEKVDTVVVDKTGTLTEGKPRLVSVVPAEGIDDRELLAAVASLERGSEHPLASAIVSGAEERRVRLGYVSNFAAIPGLSSVSVIANALRLRRVAL